MTVWVPGSRGFHWALALGLTGVAVYVFGFSTAAVQRRNLRAAEELKRNLELLVVADPRFEHVTIAVSTGGPGAGGSLVVYGVVPDAGSAETLHGLVMRDAGAVAVGWHLMLGDPEAPWDAWKPPSLPPRESRRGTD